MAFDLLHLDGEDLTGLPWSSGSSSSTTFALSARRGATNGSYDDGDAVLGVRVEHGHEGVVAKRLDSPYLHGPASLHLARAEVACVGQETPPATARASGVTARH